MEFIKVLMAKAVPVKHLAPYMAHRKISVNISSCFVSETIYEVAV